MRAEHKQVCPTVPSCASHIINIQLFAGNRIWGKELDMQLTLLDWSPDGRRLLFCTTAGDCHIIDAGGNPVSKVPLHCKASAYMLCSAVTLLSIWNAVPTYLHSCSLHLPHRTLQDDVYCTGACSSAALLCSGLRALAHNGAKGRRGCSLQPQLLSFLLLL